MSSRALFLRLLHSFPTHVLLQPVTLNQFFISFVNLKKKNCFSGVKWRLTFCNPMDCSRSGFLHYLPELARIHVSWIADAIQASHPLLSPSRFCLQSFPASGPFPLSCLFTPGGQTIGASASVLPKNIQGWFPLRLTDLISLQSKELSSIFSSTTVQTHQFFSAQSSLWSSSHIHTWLQEKP